MSSTRSAPGDVYKLQEKKPDKQTDDPEKNVELRHVEVPEHNRQRQDGPDEPDRRNDARRTDLVVEAKADVVGEGVRNQKSHRAELDDLFQRAQCREEGGQTADNEEGIGRDAFPVAEREEGRQLTLRGNFVNEPGGPEQRGVDARGRALHGGKNHENETDPTKHGDVGDGLRQGGLLVLKQLLGREVQGSHEGDGDIDQHRNADRNVHASGKGPLHVFNVFVVVDEKLEAFVRHEDDGEARNRAHVSL